MVKHKVEVHVPKIEAIKYGEEVAKSLIKYDIIATVKLDSKLKNRRYPYFTVDDRLICLRRLIKLCRGGACK